MIAAAAEISRLLAQNIRSLASELFPSGHREGQEWRAGSLLGEPGNSLGIHLTGPKAGVWSDFASGESGDALDLVRAVHRCDIAGALKWSRRWLGIEHGPADPARHPPELSKPVRPYEDDNPDRWWRPWRTAKPIAATLAETYLRCRGLHFDDPEGRVLRFQTRHARKSPTNEFEHHPAVLALLSDVSTGEPCGIVNIYLQPDGGDRIRDKKSKTSWGRVCAAAVMLDPFDAPVSGLVIAEGVETAISLQMAELHPVWATAGAGNLSVFPILGGIEAIIIAADKGEPGQKAATACGSRWRQAGREALIITPPTAEDWAARRRGPAL